MVATGFIHDMISKNQTFEEFLWTLAKGFSEMSYYRERDKISSIEWHLAQREYARKEIVQELRDLTLQKQRLMAMDEAQAITYGENLQRNQVETHERILQEYKEVNQKIDAMTQQVLEWNYPSEHHRELKRVALHQLSQSRQNLVYHETQLKTVLNTRPIEFYQMDCKSVNRQIEARTKELADYEVFTLHLTEWRTQLEASVPIPESMREPLVAKHMTSNDPILE